MTNAKLKKKKDRIVNFLLAIFFIISICSILGYIVYDHYKIKNHLQECKKICDPDEVIESLSFSQCVCRKILRPEDTI